VELLVRVEDTFALRNLGIVVWPDLSAERQRAERLLVELRRPDGSRRAAAASIQLHHIQAPTLPVDRRWRVVLVILDAEKEEIPVGTEVWRA
jgi:hypothetical protein